MKAQTNGGDSEGTFDRRVRLVGAFLCAGYGVVLLFLSISLGIYDMRKGGLAASSFMLIVPAAAILFAAIGAFLRTRIWPLVSLVSSLIILALAVRISNGSPLVLLHSSIAPLGVVALIVPTAIVLISVSALIKRKTVT